MRKQGKKYVEASAKVEKNKLYNLEEAIKLVKDTNITKFDSTVEVAIKANLDTKNNDQNLRGSVVLPKGTGKTKKILVLAKGIQAEEAKAAKADYVGDQDLIDKIEKENWFDFDVIVATPEMMPLLGKIGKILGPKGLMPNPKVGTVTQSPVKVVENIKKGMIEYKTDSYGNIHCIIGKSSFKEEDLMENLMFLIENIKKSKPASVKGSFINKISISTTMGPGIKLDLNSFDI